MKYDILKKIKVCPLVPFSSKSITGKSFRQSEISWNDDHTEGICKVYVRPNGANCFDLVKQIYTQPTGVNCPCTDPDDLQSDLQFYFGSTSEQVENYDTPEQGDTLTETTTDHYPTIRFETPDTCLAIGTTLDMLGPVDRDTIIQVTPAIDCDNVPADYNSQWTDNQIIPGALMQLTHYLNCAHPGNVVESDSEIWATCSLTGGIVTAVNGDYDDPEHTFTVRLMDGIELEIEPADWVKFRVDDWVTLLTVGGYGQNLGNKGSLDWTKHDKLLAMPAYYGKYPVNAGLIHASIPFLLGDNKPVMHLRNIPATITALNPTTNTADVNTTEFGNLIGVAFAWHCPNSVNYDRAVNAFEVDDIVNLVIPDIGHDAHINDPAIPPTPYIMGWQDMELRYCYPHLYYMGDPIICYDTEWNIQADCDADETYKYYRVLDVLENLTIEKEIDIGKNNALALNKVCKASAIEDKSGHGLYNCHRHNSIMFDRWTVHAFAWSVLVPGGDTIWKWAITIDYNGQHWPIPNPYYVPGVSPEEDEFFAHWPDEGFDEHLTCSGFESDQFYTPNHAIDLWQLESDIEKVGWSEGDIVLSLCGDKKKIEIFNLSDNGAYWPSLTGLGVRIATDFVSDPDNEYRGVVLGVKETSLYVAYAGMSHNKMLWFSQVYVYDAIPDEITTLDISGHLVVYNLFRQEIWHIDHGEISDPETFTAFYSDVTVTSDYPDPGSCVDDCVDVYHGANYIGKGAADGGGGGFCLVNNLFDYFYPYSGASGKVEGYFEGLKYTNLAKRECNCQPSLPCGNNCYGTCFGLNIGTWYFDWVASVGVPDFVSITNDGSGETREVDVWNGKEGSVVTTQETHESGIYDPDYAQSQWPYIASYAWVKHAIDSDGIEYDDIVIQEDVTGHKDYGADNEAYFFVVDANY